MSTKTTFETRADFLARREIDAERQRRLIRIYRGITDTAYRREVREEIVEMLRDA